MPPKKKTLPEPKVDVPNGDAGAGRELFDQHCSACHALEGVKPFFPLNFTPFLIKRTINQPQPPPWEVFSVERLDRPPSSSAMP